MCYTYRQSNYFQSLYVCACVHFFFLHQLLQLLTLVKLRLCSITFWPLQSVLAEIIYRGEKRTCIHINFKFSPSSVDMKQLKYLFHRDVLARWDYVKVKTIRLQGLLLSLFCLRKHLLHLRDIETQYTRTGLGGMWVCIYKGIMFSLKFTFSQVMILYHSFY
jgi:hypothetical protein